MDRATQAVGSINLASSTITSRTKTLSPSVWPHSTWSAFMRERTPMPALLLERLPRLKLIASTGPRNASIDLAAAAERGMIVLLGVVLNAVVTELNGGVRPTESLGILRS
jgi:lactate dehydrogenase-like 2-hydroxyacid dehydrogenase